MQSIRGIFQREKQYLSRQHQSITLLLQQIKDNLDEAFNDAYKQLDYCQFYVNQTFIKQISQSLEQLTNIINLNSRKIQNSDLGSKKQKDSRNQNMKQRSQINPYLIEISLKQENNQKQTDSNVELQISEFIAQQRDSSYLTLTKNMLTSNNLSKISLYCTKVSSIYLKSHYWNEVLMIKDIDVQKIGIFSRLVSLNLMGSSISDKGVMNLLKVFPELKQVNLSECCLLTDSTVKKLAGNQLVSLKINGLNSISQQVVLSLILQSYNLNYLEIKGCRQIQQDKFYLQVSKIYTSNQASFKWLQITSQIGVDLFINKLAYLTHLTTAQSITHSEVAVLLGSNKNYLNGIFFTSCEELNHSTVELICTQINSLKRLKLSRFISLNDSHIKQILIKFNDLRYLNLQQCYSLTNNSLSFIAQYSSNLQHLNIAWCRGITDQGIDRLFKKQNTSLQCINLSHLKFVSDKAIKAIARNCPQLKSLLIQKCDQVTDQAINQISQRLPSLQQLVVNYCQNLTDSSLSLVATRLRHLNRLEIQWCQVTQKCINLIGQNLKKLTILNLNFCPSVCDKEIQLISQNNSKIQTLKLQSCDKISEQGFFTLSQSLTKIKYLDLRECIGVTDWVVKSISENAQSHLQYIDLSWCSLITDNALFSLSQYQHQLISLNLSGCLQITDIGLEWVLTTLKNLEYLNLSLCEKITDKSVGMISQLRKLKRLYLCDLKRVSDVSISNLSDLTGLEELQLSGCTQISSSSLLAILHNLQKLSSLNVSECVNIKSQFLAIMLHKISSLRKLEISSLEITDQFLEQLPKHLQKLQYLNVSMCGKITDEALINLVERIPSLIKVDFQNTSISSRTKQKVVQTLNCRRIYNITLD